MHTSGLYVTILFSMIVLLQHGVFAATLYVSPISPSNGPGMAWSNAFHTI